MKKAALPQSFPPFVGGKIVTVDLPQQRRAYDIVIGDSVLAAAGMLIANKLGKRRCLVITDTNIAPLYLERCEAVLAAAGHELLPASIVAAGESSKDFATLQKLIEHILASGADRQMLIIALGGGVVGDLAGLAASLVLRGVDFVQIPTTLVAQVDSSVGGKTAINSARGKNMVGAFYQPRLVIADVSLLDSLPERELRAGYAETVKYGLIRDVTFFKWCKANGTQVLGGDRAAQIYAVDAACRHKAEIVSADEREVGGRALLNFGHTFGHALEAATGYGNILLHGEAVSIGMAMAFALSVKLGLCPMAEAEEAQAHFKVLGLPITPPSFVYDMDQLMQSMAQDKKASGGKLTLILARGIGSAFISRDVDEGSVRVIWQEFLLRG